jgi:hypothetical protein
MIVMRECRGQRLFLLPPVVSRLQVHKPRCTTIDPPLPAVYVARSAGDETTATITTTATLTGDGVEKTTTDAKNNDTSSGKTTAAGGRRNDADGHGGKHDSETTVCCLSSGEMTQDEKDGDHDAPVPSSSNANNANASVPSVPAATAVPVAHIAPTSSSGKIAGATAAAAVSAKPPARRWFNDHPVVSTVLWILGHDMNKQRAAARDEEVRTKETGILSWKDDHGGYVSVSISCPGRDRQPSRDKLRLLRVTCFVLFLHQAYRGVHHGSAREDGPVG